MCKEKLAIKEEHEEMVSLYEKVLKQESYLQGLNRHLRLKLLDAENRLVALSKQEDSSMINGSESSNDSTPRSPRRDLSKQKEEMILKENTNLLELLSLLSGLNCITFVCVGNVSLSLITFILFYLQTNV